MARKPKVTKGWGGRVEVWPLKKIKPYPNNPKSHPEEQIEWLAGVIRKRGPDQPIVVDERGVIIKGHGRLEAAHRAKRADFPVVIKEGLSATEKRAMRIEDNQASLLAPWNPELMKIELNELKIGGYDIMTLGLSEFQLSDFMGGAQSQDINIDQTVEPPKNPVVRFGDLWFLGEHRLLCGDSSDMDAVKLLLDGTTPDIANCDPPYGISIVKALGSTDGAKPFGKVKGGKPHPFAGAGRVKQPGRDGFKDRTGREHGPSRRAIIMPGVYAPIIGDETTATAVAAYKTLTDLKVKVVVLWGGNYYANELPPSRCWLVWDKENTGTFADAELAWTNQDKPVRLLRHQWSGLIKASERGEKRVHPTQKPVALSEWVIDALAPKAKTALDLFLGSGSMLIASERKGIRFFGMELAPAYIEASIIRWEKLTGRQATLNGKTIEQVTAERRRGGKNEVRDSRKSVRREKQKSGDRRMATVQK